MDKVVIIVMHAIADINKIIESIKKMINREDAVYTIFAAKIIVSKLKDNLDNFPQGFEEYIERNRVLKSQEKQEYFHIVASDIPVKKPEIDFEIIENNNSLNFFNEIQIYNFDKNTTRIIVFAKEKYEKKTRDVCKERFSVDIAYNYVCEQSFTKNIKNFFI